MEPEPMYTWRGARYLMGTCETCQQDIFPSARDENDNKIPVAHTLRDCVKELVERMDWLEDRVKEQSNV